LTQFPVPHDPQAPQAELQQTEPTQNPDWHWSTALQAEPFASFAEHVVPWHQSEEMQAESEPQVLGQLAFCPSHTYGEQLGEPALPAPLRLQVPVLHVPHDPQAVLQQMLPTQKVDWHWLLVEHGEPIGSSEPHVLPPQVKPLAQFALEEHVVGQLALAPSQRYGVQRGLPRDPAALLAQVPVVHVPHAPHALLQQTPPTQ
jgi:hypothetical protein